MRRSCRLRVSTAWTGGLMSPLPRRIVDSIASVLRFNFNAALKPPTSFAVSNAPSKSTSRIIRFAIHYGYTYALAQAQFLLPPSLLLERRRLLGGESLLMFRLASQCLLGLDLAVSIFLSCSTILSRPARPRAVLPCKAHLINHIGTALFRTSPLSSPSEAHRPILHGCCCVRNV